LFFASRTQPYHANPTTPEAYSDVRPAVARLQAFTECVVPDLPCPTPAGRMLSLSNIFFDPGDMAEINTIYDGILDETQWFDYNVAIKQKEIAAPNLPLVYGVPSVDGFDGGILPLGGYSDVTQLILPDGVRTSDGRLREHLPAIPAAKWLDLFNARYLITDRVGDDWREGAFFDLHHPVTLNAGDEISVGYIPEFAATELLIWAEGTAGRVSLQFDNGTSGQVTPEPFTDDLMRVQWEEPLQVTSLSFSAPSEAWRIAGLALVDQRDNSFRDLVPGQYRAVYSADVKIYENLDVLPRAFMVHDWAWQPDVPSAISAMRDPNFDPRQTAILIGEDIDPQPATSNQQPAPSQPTIQVTNYAPEKIDLSVETDTDGILVVTDAFYPGWRVTVDGERSEILMADGAFRGVKMPAGSHEVAMEFMPASFRWGILVSALAIIAWLALAFIDYRHREYELILPN
jgi:hypothetical protein